ncbi:MAG: DUF1902 domain-containing protein [Actinomycetes bacterium]|jgi:hypothetical protein|nr:DUF1902 domain-containing protein [Actinomycetes bacterium]
MLAMGQGFVGRAFHARRLLQPAITAKEMRAETQRPRRRFEPACYNIADISTMKGMVMAEYSVNLTWDKDAAVWVAQSDDIKGLVLESGSLDALIERIRVTAPELLKLNHDDTKPASICFRSERHELLAA